MKNRYESGSLVDSMYCSKCLKTYNFDEIQTFATCCDKPLIFSYHLEKDTLKEHINRDINSIWRYASFLPILASKNIISLGEGLTPTSKIEILGKLINHEHLYLKDETNNPTGSFKARGLSVAVSKLKELGIQKCIIPTAGNAGGALAAYCAKANIEATIIMPRHTPKIFKDECMLYGAELILVDGLINDCGTKARALNTNGDYFDMSTLKEPYRLEGKKIMGYEIAEYFNWDLPDFIFYPAGGGTGLIGIWKAFQEMITLGWIKNKLPKMIAVQSSSCAPIQEAYKDSINWKEKFTPEASIANGLAVPYPFGMDLMLNVIKESDGEACTIEEEKIKETVHLFSKKEGILISPEGAATYMALTYLKKGGIVGKEDRVLLLNTGSGYKYIENVVE
jgi:threonine synthase